MSSNPNIHEPNLNTCVFHGRQEIVLGENSLTISSLLVSRNKDFETSSVCVCIFVNDGTPFSKSGRLARHPKGRQRHEEASALFSAFASKRHSEWNRVAGETNSKCLFFILSAATTTVNWNGQRQPTLLRTRWPDTNLLLQYLPSGGVSFVRLVRRATPESRRPPLGPHLQTTKGKSLLSISALITH